MRTLEMVSRMRAPGSAGRRTRCPLVPLVVGAALVFTGADARAQRPADFARAGRYTIIGAVVDSSRRAVFGAEVWLEADGRIIGLARSRSNGRFEFDDVPRIGVAIRVRRLGYHPYGEDLPIAAEGESMELTLVLKAAVVDITPVVVEERIDRSRSHLREFYEHKRTSRFGLFLEREQIERRDVSHISDLLRTMRGVQVTAHGGVGNRVRLRGCRPVVWLNGLRVPETEVDEVAHPADVDAIEVYVSTMGMPARFLDLVGKCGVVAIWTGNGERK